MGMNGKLGQNNTSTNFPAEHFHVIQFRTGLPSFQVELVSMLFSQKLIRLASSRGLIVHSDLELHN